MIVRGVNEVLGRAMRELMERRQRGIALSGLFVKLLCGETKPTVKLLEWLGEQGLEVDETGVEEFTFRMAGLVVGERVEGRGRRRREGEVAGCLFDMYPLP